MGCAVGGLLHVADAAVVSVQAVDGCAGGGLHSARRRAGGGRRRLA